MVMVVNDGSYNIMVKVVKSVRLVLHSGIWLLLSVMERSKS